MRGYIAFSCLVGVIAILAAAPQARADMEPFTDPNFVVGNAMSDFFYVDNVGSTGSTAGAIEIDGVNDPGERWAKVFADTTAATADFERALTDNGWGGPGRGAGGAPLYWSVDLLKGSGDANTLPSDLLWNLGWNRAGGEVFFELDGGFGTVRAKPVGGTGQLTSAAFNLANGWNRVCIINDPLAAGREFVMLLNGVEVYAVDIVPPASGNVALLRTGGTIAPLDLWVDRLAQGGHYVGSMGIDNLRSDNVPLECVIPEPGSLALLGLAALPLLRRRSRI